MIPDEEELWRRIIPDWMPKPGKEDRPESWAFKDGLTGELSVHRASLTTKDEILARYPNVTLAALTAGDFRAEGMEVLEDPNDDDPSHALVRPATNGKAASRLAKKCVWVP